MDVAEKGHFIIIEGPEGSGKSTQAELLGKSYKEATVPALVTLEPGGVESSEGIRSMLLHSKWEMLPLTDLFLFEAARTEWVAQLVKPAVAKGETVITARSYISTIAYQGYASGIDLGFIDLLNKEAMQGLVPSLVIILDLDVETAFSRMRFRGNGLDRIELRAREFHQRVIEGYRRIADSGDAGIYKVDGSQSIDEVHAAVISITNAILGISLEATKLAAAP